MGQDQRQDGTAVAGDQKSPEQIRREIEATRRELGETAAALAAKTDVKARAKERVEGVKQTVTEKREAFTQQVHATSPETATSAATQVKAKARQNPIQAAAVGAFVGGFVLGRITSR
ncbi:MAG: DUF3618 domain-containing protein [Thermoleophilaceae bacterium]